MVEYQLILLIFVYLAGSLFIWLILPQLKSIDKQLLSPFIGIGFSAIAVGALLILQLSLTLISFFISLLLIFFTIKQILNKILPQYVPSKFSIKEFVFDTISIPLIVYVIISILFVKIGYGNASPDSTTFEGIGRYLEQGGILKSNVLELPFILNGRLLIVGSMHVINRMFHDYHLYALNPTICVWLLIFLSYTILKVYSPINKLNRFSIFLFLISLGLYKHYFNGMFDIHSNQLAMVYFTLSIVSLYLFSALNDRVWVYIGSLTMGFACLTRIDMLMGSLIYIFLLSVNNKINSKILVRCYSIFFIVCLPWRIFTLYHTPWDVWYVSFLPIITLLGANIICCIIFIIINEEKKLLNFFSKLPIGGIPLAMIVLFLSYPDKINLAWNLFVKFVLLGHSTWLLLVVSLIISSISFSYLIGRDKNYYILYTPAVLYLFMLFFLVAFSGYAKEDISVDRMVLHIVPLHVFSLFVGLITASGQKELKPFRSV
jgi:hypothetical protein|tara:strand:- start:311 stop:1774 length:1464 start_codon:yes stop_codon:yes gene_type:complete